MNRYFPILLSFLLLTFLSSCKAPQDIVYLQDLLDNQEIGEMNRKMIRIRPGDDLIITVTSHDPRLSVIFNLPTKTSRDKIINREAGENYSYLVDDQGNIDFAVLGTVKAAGFTRTELASLIQKQILEQNLINDPVVTVKIVNATYSVLGEVQTPGSYPILTDRMTILEGLSRAGDNTINGVRKDVLVIRENEDGTSTSYRLDLTNHDIVNSPAYYLQQNDVIYVSPNIKRQRESQTSQNVFQTPTFWITVTTTACTLILAINKFL